MKSCFLKFILIAISLCGANDSLEQTLIYPVKQDVLKPKHNYGKAVSILSFDGRKMTTNDELRESILLHPEVKDRKIVVVSIIGAFRKGKSFLMDYCLRFMYANYKSIAFMDNPLNDRENWMGDRDEPLTGFSWRGGSKRETTGIQLWSDVFLHETDFGEKVAIVLVDTQGLFDTKTSAVDNSRIFALGTLFASIQIFNLNDVIQENQLQYLQLVTDFARFVVNYSNDKTSKPFQKLLFLMRDWSNPEDFDYGYDGGSRYIKQELKISADQTNDLKSVREFIHSSYEEISCFLMPYPGEFIRKKEYDGRWSEMINPFRSELFEFVNLLLMPSNLAIKQINNNELTAKQLNDFMKSYFEIFKSEELLKVETIYEATARTQLTELISDCIEQYKSVVDMQILNYSTPYFNESLENNHQLFKNYTLSMYESSNKMGNNEQKKTFLEQLNDKIEKEFNVWKKKEFVNQKNYNDEMDRIKNAIDEREASCRMTEDSYHQTLRELDESRNENANLNKDLVKSNQEIELQKQSLNACDDKVIAADNSFKIRDQSCNNTEQAYQLSLVKLQESQEKYEKLNEDNIKAHEETKAAQQSQLSCKDDNMKAQQLYQSRDQSCNATENSYKQTFDELGLSEKLNEQLQKQLNETQLTHEKTIQYCSLLETGERESVKNLIKTRNLVEMLKAKLFQIYFAK